MKRKKAHTAQHEWGISGEVTRSGGDEVSDEDAFTEALKRADKRRMYMEENSLQLERGRMDE